MSGKLHVEFTKIRQRAQIKHKKKKMNGCIRGDDFYYKTWKRK